MKVIHLVCMLLVLAIGPIVRADRVMEKAEILDLFSQLTSRPRTVWTQTCTMAADHVEFRAATELDEDEVRGQVVSEIRKYRDRQDKVEVSEKLKKMRLDAVGFNTRYRLTNESTTQSTVLVRYDGGLFYRETTVNSREDSVKPGSEIAGNAMAEHFNLDWNRKHISAWDGQNYTRYSLPGNHARIQASEDVEHTVAGPMIAGLVAWGHGRYSYKVLSQNELVGVEKVIDGQVRIQITMASPDGSQEQLVLDPARAYAVESVLITSPDRPTVLKQNSDYQLYGDTWIPRTILEEQYERVTNHVLKSDLWTITKLDTDKPTADSMVVEYQEEAVVEYFSPVTSKSVMYRNCLVKDESSLLSERLSLEASATPFNCATVAARLVAADFGIDIADKALVPMINEVDNTTSMAMLQRSLERAGLYCSAVRTDVSTLKQLAAVKAIVHFPATNHFVIVDHVDAERVWVIDLTSRNFFRPIDIALFDMDWPDGIALLVADKPIGIAGDAEAVAAEDLESIVGSGGYICYETLQLEELVFCLFSQGRCSGYFQRYYERYGCEGNPFGSCSNTIMLRMSQCECITDFYSDGDFGYYCNVTGDWVDYYMLACY